MRLLLLPLGLLCFWQCTTETVDATEETSLQTLADAVDLGLNASGDLVYLKQNRFTVSVVKNGETLVTHRNNKPDCVDITSSGDVLTNASGFYTTKGKYPFRTIDISEGGGEIYCLANNTKTTNLYQKNNNGWRLIAADLSATRLTVDTLGRPWLLSSDELRKYGVNGGFIRFLKPEQAIHWDRFVDVGSAGESIYATLKHDKTHKRLLFNLNHRTHKWEKQIGSASRIDGSADGTLWTNN